MIVGFETGEEPLTQHTFLNAGKWGAGFPLLLKDSPPGGNFPFQVPSDLHVPLERNKLTACRRKRSDFHSTFLSLSRGSPFKLKHQAVKSRVVRMRAATTSPRQVVEARTTLPLFFPCFSRFTHIWSDELDFSPPPTPPQSRWRHRVSVDFFLSVSHAFSPPGLKQVLASSDLQFPSARASWDIFVRRCFTSKSHKSYKPRFSELNY